MLALLLASLLGIAAGLLLLRRAPTIRRTLPADISNAAIVVDIDIIIPARDEAHNLPQLLDSLHASPQSRLRTIVVDDASADATAPIAAAHGATVLSSAPLPQGWLGKTWACHQGAVAATAPTVFFLDADTFFTADGLQKSLDYFAILPSGTALSILPYHRVLSWYEELSLFFNIITAMAAGGFHGMGEPRLFGQSLLLRKNLYIRSGGHTAVRGEVLENLELAQHVTAAGGKAHPVVGRGVLEMRMFPQGPAQLCRGWRKSFTAGARSSSPAVLLLSIGWLSGALISALLSLGAHGLVELAALCIYFVYALQIVWYARQLGSFHWLTAVLYPLPLTFYFVLFAESAVSQMLRRPVEWKGRRV